LAQEPPPEAAIIEPVELPEPVLEPEPHVQPDVQPPETAEQPVLDAEPTTVEPVEINMDLSPASWALIFDYLPVEGMLRNLISNSCLIQMDGNQLLFHGDSGHMRLFSASHQQRFNEILNETLGSHYNLQVIDGQLLQDTPAQPAQRLTAEKQKAAVESIENDANVLAIRQAFDAQVIMESIRPLHL
jgi:DNA polymerase-3 subunit gamma/tau